MLDISIYRQKTSKLELQLKLNSSKSYESWEIIMIWGLCTRRTSFSIWL